MFTKEHSDQISDLLRSNPSCVIIVHRNPDGDALGSSLGLMHFLELAFKINAQVIVPDSFPHFLDWMPGSGDILVAEYQPDRAAELIINSKIIFCLDFNDVSRTAILQEAISKSNAYKVMIDHHRNPSDFCDAVYSDITASSTSEMVLRWIVDLNSQHVVDQKTAECLYTGIMTDTGSFRFESCSFKTHEMVAILLKTGMEHWSIHERILNQNTLHKLQLWGLAFKDRLVHLPEYRTAFIYLSENDLLLHNYREGDLEGLVNFALSIQDTVVGALFSQRGGKVRISFRSIGTFPVNELSSTHFSGGGHLNAAGGISDLSLEETIQKFQSILIQYPQLKAE
jgi:phosphoesterase RecJ-like protein